jgi:hypothetical protein
MSDVRLAGLEDLVVLAALDDQAAGLTALEPHRKYMAAL